MTLLLFVFDSLLGLALLWLAWQALSSPDLFRAIVLFIAFGLLMALVWIRLDAMDVALAEAAIGAGLTGALLLATLAKLEAENGTKTLPDKKQQVRAMTDSHQPTKSHQPIKSHQLNKSPRLNYKSADNQISLWMLLIVLLCALVSGLVFAVLTVPENAPGLGLWVAENLKMSGVTNPVTAVLLNFRGYDTLLEMSVLLLVLIGVWSLGSIAKYRESLPEPVLSLLSNLLVPLLIMVSGYLLWVGAHASGGAFQAGSVLGAAGVLLLLTGWRLNIQFAGLALRIALILGLGFFVVFGVLFIISGRQFLEYSPLFSGPIILLIEAAATLSIGITLAALFLGGRPDSRRHK